MATKRSTKAELSFVFIGLDKAVEAFRATENGVGLRDLIGHNPACTDGVRPHTDNIAESTCPKEKTGRRLRNPEGHGHVLMEVDGLGN